MLMAPLFQPFIDRSPLSVMARLTIERTLRPELLDQLFERSAQRQYTQDLLFSSLVDLMSLVTCGSAKHVQASFQRLKDRIPSLSSPSTKNSNAWNPASLPNWCEPLPRPVNP
jgi:hypothetical protein